MYNHKEIEKKWQKFWEENKTFKVQNDFSKPKYYTLDMFPYPSGAGLHVGHPEGMTANDIVARYKTANGFNVLHPMGRDAFGLPAENYAIKTGTHPRITTDANIQTFKKQIQALGFSYDWDREIDTTDPKYYKWTQWIFLKLFEAGLAYEQDLPINYCPSCKTGLANEEVLNDGTCDRCGTTVEKKKIRQWVLAITKYADRLATDVDKLDWPEGIKDMQRNWIGRSEGCEFSMKAVVNAGPRSLLEIPEIAVYTTRIDTVFGMTYAVMAPDHKDVMNFITDGEKESCLAYIETAKNKSDQDRTGSKEKTGVFTGTYVINLFNQEKIPVYIGDYVLGNYGTGAVMAVPAHDERDFEFAKVKNIEIKESILGGNIEEAAFCEDGILVNSGEFTGLSSAEARIKLTEFAETNGFGTKKVNYKLRDWLFSRQRYWGEPIPLVHLDLENLKKLPHISSLEEATDANIAYILKRNPVDGEQVCESAKCKGMVRELVIGKKVFSKIYDGIYTKIVCDYRLPLELPEVEDFAPSGDGQSPLAKVDSFIEVKLADNLNGNRETNTMPQWGGSCWYYLRYMDPNNDEQLVDPEVEKYWGQVDSYVGGAEHAVLHLLYARFWHKFLFDIGVVSHDEPFYRLRNQGLIQAFAYQRANGGLIANDLVEEKDGKFYEKSTGEELKQIISKMSKSLKNVVNPDDIVEEYGADSLRLYEMYMADFKDSAPWNPNGIVGVRRFIERLERIFEEDRYSSDDKKAMKQLHKTIKKVSEDIENYKFNTAISSMMILLNEGMPKDEKLKKEWKETFVKLVHPFAPHLAEELWERINISKDNSGIISPKSKHKSIFLESWPKFDADMAKDDVVVIGVQVLGKLRGEIEINIEEDEKSVLEKARNNEQVAKWLDGKTIVKEIYVKGKIVNIVVK
ncbi:MAG: leucine--tRNA ligase [Candidatus Gracilibacteria bacterium]|nr:leucine--tRNA ligase [Candidatus Gracilibacteria bacterium]